MDPRHFDVLYRRYRDAERMADYRSGVIAAAVANVLRGKDSEPITAADFFPSLRVIFRPAQTPEAMLKVVEMWNAALGGKDLRKQTH